MAKEILRPLAVTGERGEPSPVRKRGKPGLPDLPKSKEDGGSAAAPVRSYYSKPELGTDPDGLYDTMKQRGAELGKYGNALWASQRSHESDMQTLNEMMEKYEIIRSGYETNPTEETRAMLCEAMEIVTQQAKKAAGSKVGYGEMYEQYLPVLQAYQTAQENFQSYIQSQQEQLAQWKSTIRDAGSIEADLEELDRQVLRIAAGPGTVAGQSAYLQGSAPVYGTPYGAKSQAPEKNEEWDRLEAQRALLEEELEWSRYFKYNDLRENPDFEEKSGYIPTGGLDERYDYINKNDAVVFRQSIEDQNSGAQLTGMDNSHLQLMNEEQVAVYNYLYATEGRDAANEYIRYIKPQLTKMQRAEIEGFVGQASKEHPIIASALSVGMAPLRGLSYLGQAAELLTRGSIDQNAGYNRFSYMPTAVRNQVSELAEEKWGPAGSFAYQTAMSMGDFMLNAGLTGGSGALSLAVMGSGAAADCTIAAKDRGLDDAQAFTLGTVAGIAEALTEKFSLDKLLDVDLLADGAMKYILANMATEGSEEVASSLINLLADIVVSRDQSEWQASIDAYMEEGLTEGQAFARALGDQALSLALDALGGAISGGVMAGGNAVLQGRQTRQIGSFLEEQKLSREDIQLFIEEGLESAPQTPAHRIAVEVQQKLNSGKELTDEDLSRLWQANIQAVAEEQVESDDAAPAESVSKLGHTVTEEGKNVTGDNRGVSVAEQIRSRGGTGVTENTNGGFINGNVQSGAQGPGAAQTGAGDRSLYGGGQRHDGTGTGEQAPELGSSAERVARTDRSRTTVARQNLARSLRLEKISSQELGLQSGTEVKNIQVMPKEHWDQEMSRVAERIYNETEKEVTYVMGRIQIRTADGVGYARGVITDSGIIVQADHFKVSVEQIADHEAYHAKTDFAGKGLNDEIRRHIIETFGKDEFRAVLEKYIVAMRGVIDVDAAENNAEFEAAVKQIEEEVFADAYAGINAFDAHADRFTEEVNRHMDQLHLGKQTGQENGTEQPTGPPNERYSSDDPEGLSLPTVDEWNSAGKKESTAAAGSAGEGYLKSASMSEQEANDGRRLADFIGQVNGMIDKSRKSKRKFKIGSVSANHASIINRIMAQVWPGFDASGYELWIDGTGASHIEERHGEYGRQDHSMASAEAKMLIPWAAQNATRGGFILDKNGSPKLSDRYLDRNGKRAPEIGLEKEVDNDTVYVSECVPDSANRRIWITSAYIKKGSNGQMLNMEDSSLQPTPEAPFDGNATTDIVATPSQTVKERFSYAGERAESADLEALARAKEMRSAGVADETIRQQTGWFVGMDGKWRWEIDDSGMRYHRAGDALFSEMHPEYARHQELMQKFLYGELTAQEETEFRELDEIWGREHQRLSDRVRRGNATLQNILKHDKLFEAYPRLRGARVTFENLPEGTRGQYNPENNSIVIRESLRNAPENTLIHEIQHAIQNIEGFSSGASPEYWEEIQNSGKPVRINDRRMAEAEKGIQRILESLPANVAEQFELHRKLEKEDPDAAMELADELSEGPYGDAFSDYFLLTWDLELAEGESNYVRGAGDLYRNTAGEIEARDTAARREMTDQQRRETAPATGNDLTVFADGAGSFSEVLEELDLDYATPQQAYVDTEFSAEDLRENIRAVADMEPVAEITGKEFAKGEVDLITQVERFFDGLGNEVRNERLGDVILDRRGVKSDIAHGIGRKKAAAFAAVPDVIRNGLVVDYQENWKNRGYDTAVVAAPVRIAGQEHIAGVIVVRSRRSNRFYLHEVMTTENGALPFKTGALKQGDSGGDAPSIFSILDKIRAVKNAGQTEERFSVEDVDSHGHDLSEEQKEYFAKSQARDDSGRLLVLYHQTDAEFTVFDTRHSGAGSTDGQTPFGIFLKRSAGDIGLAGKRQMALYANIANPLRATNREDLDRKLRNLSPKYADLSNKHKALDAEYHEKFEQAKKAWRDYVIEWRSANPDANRRSLNDDPRFNELFDAEDAVVEEWTEAADRLSVETKEAVTEDLRRAGFDGVFLENDAGSWGRRTDAIIALDPEQVKNITNRTPTSNPDIRYSVDDTGAPEVKVPSQEELNREREAWLQEEYNRKAQQQESRPLIAKRDLRRTVLDLFSVPAGQRAELGTMVENYAERLIKNGSIAEEDRKAFFDRMYDAGVMTVPADEYHAMARSHIVDGRIYVTASQKAEFGDNWADIRRRAFAAGVYLVNDRNAAGIDQWNSTLAEEDMLPGLFDSEETDPRSILERIIQVAEEGRDEHLSLPEYTRRLSMQEGISEDEFLDIMERKLDEALRTFAEKAKLEVTLRDSAKRQVAREKSRGDERVYRYAYQDAQRRARERQARKEMAQRQKDRKELRELQQKTLKQLQWLSKNQYRAPEELKGTWDEILGDIDLYAVGAADEMRWSDRHQATWKDLAQMYKDAQKNDPNFLPSKELERIVTRLDAAKIEDMDLGALQDLYKAAVGLRTEFYNRNNVISDEMNRLFEEVYSDSKREIEAAPGGYTGKFTDKLMNMDQLTPMNVLQRMGGWDPNGAFYSMAKQLERGERDMRAYTVKANRMLQEFLTEHEEWVMRADGQGDNAIWYEIEVPQLVELGMGDKPIFGPTVKVWMTPAQKVHMYLESKNLDNLRHMTGGRTFVNKDLYSQGKRQEALSQGTTIRMAPETVKKIVSDLTAEEMELARVLDRYYNAFATGEINRVSNILYGYDKAMGKNYAPIYTNRNYTKSEFGVFDATAEGVGNLKGRQAHAVNPSYNISAFDAFERHVDQTARFCGMAIPARNWTTLLNWREKNNSTGDVITHKWGEEGKKYIEDLITTLQAGDDFKTDTVSSTVAKLQSNYITAIFGANPSIVLKQLGSIPMASAYLGGRNAPKIGQIRSINRDLISKYTQDLEWRTMGYSMPETRYLKENPTTMLMKLEEKIGSSRLPTETRKKLDKGVKFVFGGDAITAMDGWAASTLWPWAENKVRREHPELEIGTQAQVDAGESPFYKKVAEEFENAVSRSQSTSDEIHQSRLRKSKNPVTKAFTMFRSDSAQTYNTIRQKIGEAQYLMRTGAEGTAVKAAKKAAGAAFFALLLNAAWAESVSFLMAMWKNKGKYYRNNKDELTAGSVIGEMVGNMAGSIAGTVTWGEELYEIAGNILTGKKIYDIETPGVEQLNDVIDVLTDAGKGMRELVADGWDIVKNGGDLGQYFAEHGNDMLGNLKDLAEAACMYLPGIPVSNVEAYLMGAMKWVAPGLATAYEDLFSSAGKSDLAGLEGDALDARIGGILEGRGLNVSDQTVRAIAELYEADQKKAMPSDVPAKVTIDKAEHELSPYQQQAYGEIWSGIVSGSLDEIVRSSAFRMMDQEDRAKMLTKLYDYASDRAKAALFDDYETSSGTRSIDEMVAAGLSLAECIEWQASVSGMNNSEKYSALRNLPMSNEDKRIILGSVLGTEMETESGKPSQYAKMLEATGAGLSVDEWLDISMQDISVDDYLELADEGMRSDTAIEFLKDMADAEVAAGDDGLEDIERWKVCVEFSDDTEDQMVALSTVMSQSRMTGVEIADTYGIAPADYVRFCEVQDQCDENGSGTLNQWEVETIINTEFSGLSNEQKAALWQIMCVNTKTAKSNPYSTEIGQKVLNEKQKRKESEEEGEPEGLTLGSW